MWETTETVSLPWRERASLHRACIVGGSKMYHRDWREEKEERSGRFAAEQGESGGVVCYATVRSDVAPGDLSSVQRDGDARLLLLLPENDRVSPSLSALNAHRLRQRPL
jgi:hypothetical protein